jgi:N-sulfoglucosamine sulfohydrolase
MKSALIWFVLIAVGVAHADPRPNIVLFIADDVSAGDFGCYGHPSLRTPHVNALAAGGLRFSNAYLTISSCSPTRTSLITGRYPHNTGAPELHMDKSPHLGNLPQFPRELREAGYHTAQAGKWHFNGDASGSFVTRRESEPSGAENWIPLLRDRPQDKPFFMWFAAIDAHRDWDQPLAAGPHGPADAVVPPYLVDGPATREDLAHYYNEVHRFDANIGRVVDELKRQGVYENTILIVMADNGRPFPRDKSYLTDSGIKTPLVIHWPAGITRPAVPGSLVSTIDLAPTILELAGVARPRSFQGVSLVPVLRDPTTKLRDFVFAERNWHVQRYHERMVRHGDFVYIRNNLPGLTGFNIVNHTNGFPADLELVARWRAGTAAAVQNEVFAIPRPIDSLYDVGKDPLQLHNLAGSPEHADTLRHLQAVLSQWTAETGDTLPKLSAMTADRHDRDTWKAVLSGGGRPPGGTVPGESTQAWTILRSGPVLTNDVKANTPP